MSSTTASSDAHRRNCDKAEGGELEHRSPRRDTENAQRIRLRCGTAPGGTPVRGYVGAEHSDRDRSAASIPLTPQVIDSAGIKSLSRVQLPPLLPPGPRPTHTSRRADTRLGRLRFSRSYNMVRCKRPQATRSLIWSPWACSVAFRQTATSVSGCVSRNGAAAGCGNLNSPQVRSTGCYFRWRDR